MNHEPFVAAETRLPELTFKVIVISILLALLLAASNAYLALKIGILTSASIPAAILSMGILRFFKRSNILENNLIQTAASAGEAIAGGVVYTIPALIIIRYWDHFDYLQTLAIALLGGMLGVMFSIPLRHILVTDKRLGFPEGTAIAEVLKVGADRTLGLKQLILGGIAGGLLEACQTGFKIVANNLQFWFISGRELFGFGTGLSATLIGAGYLIGFNIGLSLFVGAIVGWFILVPVLTSISHAVHSGTQASQLAMNIWDAKIRYVGIGAMLTSGIWTLSTLVKPFVNSMKVSVAAFKERRRGNVLLPRTEQDLPMPLVFAGVIFFAVILTLIFNWQINSAALGLSNLWQWPLILSCVLYVLIFGFIFSAICGYFSGMVGVTASPGSAIVIAGVLLAALFLRFVLSAHGVLTHRELQAAEAVIIMVVAVITGSACIANDNIQDLKVGYILGATPWKQQVMLMVGAIVAALVIPPIMEALFNVYGIAGVFPRPGMDHSQMLSAPPAALLAAIAQGVLSYQLPWNMIFIGVGISVLSIIVHRLLQPKGWTFSVLGVAMGIYFPLSTTTPLFIGALFSLIAKGTLNRRAAKSPEGAMDVPGRIQKGVLLACGLVAGAALMDVLLAIPMSITHNPDILNIMPKTWTHGAEGLGVIITLLMGVWFYKTVCEGKS